MDGRAWVGWVGCGSLDGLDRLGWSGVWGGEMSWVGGGWDGVERSALEPDWEQNLHELIESAAPEIKEVSSTPFRSLR